MYILSSIECAEAVWLCELRTHFRATRCSRSSDKRRSLFDLRSLTLALALWACCDWRDTLAERVDLSCTEFHKGRSSAYTFRRVSTLALKLQWYILLTLVATTGRSTPGLRLCA